MAMTVTMLYSVTILTTLYSIELFVNGRHFYNTMRYYDEFRNFREKSNAYERYENSGNWRDISSDLSDILSTKIFFQPDPIHYLIEETSKLPRYKVFGVKASLKMLLKQENKLPQIYVPYAQVLSEIVNCQSYLAGVTRAIRRIRSSVTSDHSVPNFNLGQTEISQLFSLEIFSDKNAPLQLLIKLIDTSTEKIASISIQLEAILRSGRLPQQYSDYATQMIMFLKRESPLSNLKQSVAQLRNISAIKLPIFVQHSSTDQSHNESNTPSAKVPDIDTPSSESKSEYINYEGPDDA